MKTRDKIILGSLDLFNERGERTVTTNHIAAHLGISPGNLYYHFRNKSDIVFELFQQYELLVDHYLQVPDDRPLTAEDSVQYLEQVFDGLWSYRFLHRDLENLLDEDPRLRRDYKQFTSRCLDGIKQVLRGLQEGKVLIPMDAEQMDSMALNVWLVITNWMAFLKTAHAGEENNAITKEQLKQGIYQVLTLELPYLTPESAANLRAIRETYRPDPYL